jgi:uncharacterized RDD family membrane protein YckC
MECPRCAKEIVPDRLFCIWCEAFVPRSEAGVKAGIFRRWLALTIDPLIPYFLGIIVYRVGREWRPSPLDDTPYILMGVVTAIYAVAAILLMRRGMTPGKWILSERVVDKMTGEPVGFWRMFFRELLKNTVSSIPLGLGFFWAIWDRDGQAWHDKIAGTVVVKEDRPVPLTPARGLRPGGATP